MKFALLQNTGKCGRYGNFVYTVYLFVLRAEKFYRYICHSPPQSLAIMEDIFVYFANYNKIRNSLKIAIIHSVLTNLDRNIM